MHNPSAPDTLDYTPDQQELLEEVLQGLRSTSKWIPSKLLYDGRGSELFEKICETREYYLTRAELEIMRLHASEMAAACGPRCMVIEYGSGSSTKTRLLLDALHDPAAYVPIDISIDALQSSVAALARAYPQLDIVPLCADYTAEYAIPERVAGRRIVYFPGSTFGNFELGQAQRFLLNAVETCGSGGALLIGLDLHKSSELLEPAYDDATGITAEFELNVLSRLNREFGANFEVSQFAYESFYNEQLRRIEMYVVSCEEQRVQIDGVEIPLAAGERIRTEYSYKYELNDFERLADKAGLRLEHVWLDSGKLFSVQLLSVP